MPENVFPSAFETNYRLHISVPPSGKNKQLSMVTEKNAANTPEFQKWFYFSITRKKTNLQNVPPLPTCADLQTVVRAPMQAHTRRSSPLT